MHTDMEHGQQLHTFVEISVAHFKTLYILKCTADIIHKSVQLLPVNNWKCKFSDSPREVREPPEKFSKIGRPSMVGEELLLKIKEVIIRIRLTGAVISRKMLISIDNGVLKANDPNSLLEFVG